MLIQEYQKRWIEDFNKIKNEVAAALKGLEIVVEHVGSTAVPELAAKPIIDIDIVYSGNSDFDEIKERLRQIGYYHNGNQGIPRREVFKREKTGIKHEVLDVIAHHLYVCPVTSEELQKHILFRDYLVENEDARIQYQHLKYKIAGEADQDKRKYAQLKEALAKDFISGILAKAEGERN